MAEQEMDPERRERIDGFGKKILTALEGATPEEAYTTIAHVLSHGALSTNDPEQAILHAIAAISECYIGMRDYRREGRKPEVTN